MFGRVGPAGWGWGGSVRRSRYSSVLHLYAQRVHCRRRRMCERALCVLTTCEPMCQQCGHWSGLSDGMLADCRTRVLRCARCALAINCAIVGAAIGSAPVQDVRIPRRCTGARRRCGGTGQACRGLYNGAADLSSSSARPRPYPIMLGCADLGHFELSRE